MDAWELADVEAARVDAGRLYHEFLSVPDLSAGLYVLEAGATDPQSPHGEDELYYVVEGRAGSRVGDDDRAVEPGSLVFVGGDRSRTRSTTSPSGSSCSWPSGRPRARGAGQRPASAGELAPRAASGAAPGHGRSRRGGRTRRRRRRRQERLQPRRPVSPARPACSRGDAAGGTGTARSGGGSAAPRRRVTRSRRSPPRPRVAAAVTSSAAQDGSWNSRVSGTSRGQAASSAGEPLVVALASCPGRGTGRCPAARRTPGTDRSARACPAPGPRASSATSRRAGP